VTPLSSKQRSSIQKRLLDWYEENRRSLPWRDAPHPYSVWVSEVMLQQTRVETVRDYFARWMAAFPTVTALAESSEEDVLRIWQGLGYYSRARRLRDGAKYLLEEQGGELPATVEELLKVPGVGPYSAGAISSIAFGKKEPLVDGNVIRVLARWFCLPGDPNKSPLKKELWRLAGELVPGDAPGAFNQGLMELGATVCTPKSPSCISCPMRKSCGAYKAGETTRFPELPKRKKPTQLHFALAFFRHRGRYAVLRLPADARWWSGLDAFPFIEGAPGQFLELLSDWAKDRGIEPVGGPVELPVIRHTVTRYKIDLLPLVFTVKSRGGASGELAWRRLAELEKLSLPSPHRKAVALLKKLHAAE